MAVLFTRRGAAPSLGKRASDYAVGDIVKIPINGTNTEFLVVHQGNPDTAIYDASCDGTWLIAKNSYTNQRWSATNNSYGDSSIVTYLNSTFYAMLSNAVQSSIKSIKLPYRPGSGNSQSCNTMGNGLPTKIFLLSGCETGWPPSVSGKPWVPINEGSKLDYFESGDTSSARQKRESNREWWTRSPRCDVVGHTSVIVFSQYGWIGENEYSSTYPGVRPTFIINSDTKFDSDTNVIL